MVPCKRLPEEGKKLRTRRGFACLRSWQAGGGNSSWQATTVPTDTSSCASSFRSTSMSGPSWTQSNLFLKEIDTNLESMLANDAGQAYEVPKPREGRCMACLRGCWFERHDTNAESIGKDGHRARGSTSGLPSFTSRLSLPALLVSQHTTFWQSDHCGEQTDDVQDEQMYHAIDFDLEHRKNKFTALRELKKSGQLAATASKLEEAETAS